jgi:hypothetical protein
MKLKQYKKLRAALQARRDQAVATADETQRELDALDLVWSVAQRESGGNTGGSGPAVGSRSDLPDRIRAAVGGFPGEFSYSQVVEALKSFYPEDLSPKRTTVVSILSRLVDSDEIKLISAGKGRKPAVYRRIDPVEPPPP